jgi:hypothetical protein
MATTSTDDLKAKLSDLNRDAMKRLADAPGGDKLVAAMNATRERVDDLQRRIRGIDELEVRLTALEKKVDKLAKASHPKAAPKSDS